MSRLIDADDFEKFIKEKYKDGESTDDIKDQMLFDLSYQPTAYDVEKVVAELENFKSKRSDDSVYGIGVLNGYSEAIDIVKRGGLE